MTQDKAMCSYNIYFHQLTRPEILRLYGQLSRYEGCIPGNLIGVARAGTWLACHDLCVIEDVLITTTLIFRD